METIRDFFDKYLRVSTMTFAWHDALEIIIFAVMIYNIIMWIMRSRAWTLLKGAITIIVFYLLAVLLHLNNLLLIFRYVTTYIVIGAIVIFQPEIRKALEQLGTKIYLFQWLPSGDPGEKGEFSEESEEAIIEAACALGREKVGALIVIEQRVVLDEWAENGIYLHADISAALLKQIFVHNTPLHDGAVIIRNNEILAATCVLPLSKNQTISKELGTRHRAGLGISEATDSLTVIVSEETGGVTFAKGGALYRNLDEESLRSMLQMERRKSKRKNERRSFINRKNRQKE